MLAILAICEKHGQDLEWFDGLPAGEQELHLARWNHQQKQIARARKAAERNAARGGRR